MDLLKFKKNKLHINNIKLEHILKKKQTPFYLYSFNQIRQNIKYINMNAFHSILDLFIRNLEGQILQSFVPKQSVPYFDFKPLI